MKLYDKVINNDRSSGDRKFVILRRKYHLNYSRRCLRRIIRNLSRSPQHCRVQTRTADSNTSASDTKGSNRALSRAFHSKFEMLRRWAILCLCVEIDTL